jgi:hypothetical protein
MKRYYGDKKKMKKEWAHPLAGRSSRHRHSREKNILVSPFFPLSHAHQIAHGPLGSGIDMSLGNYFQT